MRRILARAGAPVLSRFARSRVLVAFDYDGTLAPIVADRERAAPRDATRRLLAEVCGRYACAVISGRGRDDVAARVDGAGVRYVMGNHGMEPSPDLARFEALMGDVRPRVAAALAGVAGVEVEDKRVSLAIHYRRAPSPARAREAVERALDALPHALRRVPGKRVVNVTPAGAPHKGDALMALVAREGADAAIFVGDDDNDEDVFALDRAAVLGIRVGRSARSAAAWCVRDQAEVDDLLRALVRERPQGG